MRVERRGAAQRGLVDHQTDRDESPNSVAGEGGGGGGGGSNEAVYYGGDLASPRFAD